MRRLYDLRDVAFDNAWFEVAPDRDAYCTYRDLVLTCTDERPSRHQLRYDSMMIPPLKIGLEFVKAYGTIAGASTRSSLRVSGDVRGASTAMSTPCCSACRTTRALTR